MSQKDRQLDLTYNGNDNFFLKQREIFNKLFEEIPFPKRQYVY